MDPKQAIYKFADQVANHFVGILLIFLAFHFLRNKYQNNLGQVSGPTIAGFTNLWRLHQAWTGKLHLKYAELHRQYGALVRIGPNVVSVGDPKAIPVIYGLNAGFKKSKLYSIFTLTYRKKVLKNIFAVDDEARHKKMRRPIANAYSLAAILEMEANIDSCSRLFLSQMDQFASLGDAVDLGEWVHFYAADVAGEITFDKKLGFLEEGKDVDGIIRSLDMLAAYGGRCGQIPILHKFLLGNPLLIKVLPVLEMYNSVLNFTLKVIESRGDFTHDGKVLELDDDCAGRDQLSRWSAISAKDPSKISTEDLVVHTTANVMGGTDTTAATFRSVIYNLLRHPDLLAKLVREIDQAAASGQLSNLVTYKEVTAHLPYLQAIVKEAFRIHPSVPMIFERYVPAGGVEICGQYMPAGTNVGINPWVVQHDPNVFPDPEAFIPERWIENSPDRLREMEASMLLFGAGSRSCPGKSLAQVQLYKLITEIFRRFTVVLVHPEKEWTVENRWFLRMTGLICKLSRRENA